METTRVSIEEAMKAFTQSTFSGKNWNELSYFEKNREFKNIIAEYKKMWIRFDIFTKLTKLAYLSAPLFFSLYFHGVTLFMTIAIVAIIFIGFKLINVRCLNKKNLYGSKVLTYEWMLNNE